jgi:uncharacterized cupredoxin-like copper-binding protein
MKKIYLTLAITLSFFLAGCGQSQPTTAINVSMTDFAYIPNNFVVPAGREIKVDLVNNGAVKHSFIIMKSGTVLDQDLDEEDNVNIYWKIELAPGQNTTTSFIAPSEPGEYMVVCSIAGHYEAGMTGRLVVVKQ